MRMIFEKRYLALFCVLALALGTMLPGCSDDDPLGPTTDNMTDPIPFDVDSPFDEAIAKGMTVIMQDGRTPPANQVTFEASGRMVTSWPYTGTRLDGTPNDPISLVLTGDVDILASARPCWPWTETGRPSVSPTPTPSTSPGTIASAAAPRSPGKRTRAGPAAWCS